MKKDGIYYYDLGMEHLERDQLEDALGCFIQSSELDQHFKTYQRIAHILNVLERFEEAQEFTEKAYMSNKKNDMVAFEYAEILLKLGQSSAAQEILKDILKRNPSHGPARKLLLSDQ